MLLFYHGRHLFFRVLTFFDQKVDGRCETVPKGPRRVIIQSWYWDAGKKGKITRHREMTSIGTVTADSILFLSRSTLKHWHHILHGRIAIICPHRMCSRSPFLECHIADNLCPLAGPPESCNFLVVECREHYR